MKILTAFSLLLAAAPLVWADSAADELLGAQAAYRAALKAQTGSNSRIGALQSELSAAQSRMQQAQAEVVRLQEKLQEETAAKAQADSELQAAGQRLDAAWQASRNNANP